MGLRDRIPRPEPSLPDPRGLRSRLGALPVPGAIPVPDALPRPDVDTSRLRSAATALSLVGLGLAVAGVLGRLLIDRREAAETDAGPGSEAAVPAPPDAPDDPSGGDERTDASAVVPDRGDVSPGDDDPQPASGGLVEGVDESPDDSSTAGIDGTPEDRIDETVEGRTGGDDEGDQDRADETGEKLIDEGDEERACEGTASRSSDESGRVDPDTGAPRIAPLVGIAVLVAIRLIDERFGDGA